MAAAREPSGTLSASIKQIERDIDIGLVLHQSLHLFLSKKVHLVSLANIDILLSPMEVGLCGDLLQSARQIKG